jgi:hypothetical protein
VASNSGSGSEDSPAPPPAVQEEVPEEEEVYTVEKIKDKRIVDGKVQYYLKWKGYGP